MILLRNHKRVVKYIFYMYNYFYKIKIKFQTLFIFFIRKGQTSDWLGLTIKSAKVKRLADGFLDSKQFGTCIGGGNKRIRCPPILRLAMNTKKMVSSNK